MDSAKGTGTGKRKRNPFWWTVMVLCYAGLIAMLALGKTMPDPENIRLTVVIGMAWVLLWRYPDPVRIALAAGFFYFLWDYGNGRAFAEAHPNIEILVMSIVSPLFAYTSWMVEYCKQPDPPPIPKDRLPPSDFWWLN